MKPHYLLVPLIAALLFLVPSCGGDKPAEQTEQPENLYDENISTSYTVALPDEHGEGLRITYTFFNMKRVDTGNFKMTHVYMHHTGTEDTTIVNGTWKLVRTDTGDFINAYSGRALKQFQVEGGLNLLTLNTDSTVADTGLIRFRQKRDNNMHNSTVRLFGKVEINADRNATFIENRGDTIAILKISAYPDLLAKNDSINLNSPSIQGIELIGTIQIRMAMDGRSTQKSLIVEEVGAVR